MEERPHNDDEQEIYQAGEVGEPKMVSVESEKPIEGEALSSKVSKMKLIQRAGITVVIAVVAIVGIYAGGRFMLHQHRLRVVQPPAAPAQQQMPAPLQAVSPPAVHIDNSADLINDLKQEIEQLQNEEAQHDKGIDQLVDHLQQVEQQNQAHLLTLAQAISGINEQLTQLVQVMQRLDSDVAMIQAEQEAEKEKSAEAEQKREREIRQQKQFYVTAVIPGRVWLKSRGGETMTVTVGDMLEGYGKVLSIDPYNGEVVTASGVKIEYGHETG